MADTAIFDLVAETAMTAAHEFVVQDTSAATVAQAATFALMGGLEYDAQTVTTTDITGAVGKLYGVTIAGLTANRNLTLPSAQVGERLGVHVIDGDASFELILKGAASQTINGGSAATEWSRVFIAGETVVFRCTAANTWIVEYDGRIPCAGSMYNSVADTNYFTDGDWLDIPVDAETFDVGDINDVANMYFDLRRAGEYQVSVVAGSSENPNDADNFFARVTNDADTTLMLGLWQTSGGANAWIASNASGMIQVSISDLGTTTGRIRGSARYIDNTSTGALNAGTSNRITIHEVL